MAFLAVYKPVDRVGMGLRTGSFRPCLELKVGRTTRFNAFAKAIPAAQSRARSIAAPAKLEQGAAYGSENRSPRRRMLSHALLSVATIWAATAPGPGGGAAAVAASTSAASSPAGGAPGVVAAGRVVASAAAEGQSGFISGIAVSLVKQTVLYPVDTVKVRLQTMPLNNGEKMWTRTGLFKGVYRGFLVPLIFTAPAGGMFFAVRSPSSLPRSYPLPPSLSPSSLQPLCTPSLTHTHAPAHLTCIHIFQGKDAVKKALEDWGNIPSTLVAIFVAQFPYWLVRQPSEILKVREQAMLGTSTDSTGGSGVVAALRAAGEQLDVRRPGVGTSLFQGFGSNLLYTFPADALKFVVYDFLKVEVKKKRGAKPNALEAAALGSLSTIVAQVFTTPLDVARNRIMRSSNTAGEKGGKDKDYSKESSPSAMKRIFEEEGASALMLGLTPRWVSVSSTQCNTLQRTATQCNTLQHSAAHYRRL